MIREKLKIMIRVNETGKGWKTFFSADFSEYEKNLIEGIVYSSYYEKEEFIFEYETKHRDYIVYFHFFSENRDESGRYYKNIIAIITKYKLSYNEKDKLFEIFVKTKDEFEDNGKKEIGEHFIEIKGEKLTDIKNTYNKEIIIEEKYRRNYFYLIGFYLMIFINILVFFVFVKTENNNKKMYKRYENIKQEKNNLMAELEQFKQENDKMKLFLEELDEIYNYGKQEEYKNIAEEWKLKWRAYSFYEGLTIKEKKDDKIKKDIKIEEIKKEYNEILKKNDSKDIIKNIESLKIKINLYSGIYKNEAMEISKKITKIEKENLYILYSNKEKEIERRYKNLDKYKKINELKAEIDKIDFPKKIELLNRINEKEIGINIEEIKLLLNREEIEVFLKNRSENIYVKIIKLLGNVKEKRDYKVRSEKIYESRERISEQELQKDKTEVKQFFLKNPEIYVFIKDSLPNDYKIEEIENITNNIFIVELK